jgi:hypothetical protein
MKSSRIVKFSSLVLVSNVSFSGGTIRQMTGLGPSGLREFRFENGVDLGVSSVFHGTDLPFLPCQALERKQCM